MRIFFIFIGFLVTITVNALGLPLNTLHSPPGFKITLYAIVPDARQMALAEDGTVFVGSRQAGNVYAIINTPKGNRVLKLATGLDQPNGVAYYKGSLYVAVTDQILRYDAIERHLTVLPKPVIISQLPKQQNHNWHFIAFGPDGKLYVGIGANCDVCLSTDPRLATIIHMNADGSHFEIYAKGVRNSVGFDWDPLNDKLWFTDNGRDMMGDNIPPDKINYAPRLGMNFGFPYYHGHNIPDPEYGKLRPKTDFTMPTYELPAHVAALGMNFYRGKDFPPFYQHAIFIAEHGSWNRSSKVGYQVIVAKVTSDKITEVKPFVTGWLQGQVEWGRPVDTLELADGSLLISDDYLGVIYQVKYKK